MSQETYTFACPVCAVRLSVPKALAGVRGPCPQCHHEITAPEPDQKAAVALAAAPASAAGAASPVLSRPTPPAVPPLPPTPPLPEPPPRLAKPPAQVVPHRAAPPPLPRSDTSPIPEVAAAVPLEAPIPSVPPASIVPPVSDPIGNAAAASAVAAPPAVDPTPAEPAPPPQAAPTPLLAVGPPPLDGPAPIPLEAVAIEAEPVVQAGPAVAERRRDTTARPVKRRSGWRALAACLIGLGLAAAAALNFLPRQSLRQWAGRWVPALAGEVAPDAATAPPSPSASPSPIEVEIRPALDVPGTAESKTAPPTGFPDPATEIPEAVPAEPVPSPTDSAAAGPSPENPAGEPAAAAAPSAAADAATGAEAPATSEPPATPETPANTVAGGPDPTAPESASPPVPAAAVPVAAQESPPSLLPDISGGDPPANGAPVDEAIAGAQEALTLFLQSRSWKDRLALSEGGESLKPEMAEHYAKVSDGPNQPTSVEHIASAPLPGGERTVQVFHVTFADLPQGFPVPVRQTEEGWKIDWRAFTEFREGRLKKFLAGYQDPPAVFRVRLQRTHVQDRTVPNLDKKYAFRIAAPIDGHEGYVFVDKEDSIVGPKIADKLDGNTIHLVMAKLKWVRGTNGQTYVELRDIVSNSWREAN